MALKWTKVGTGTWLGVDGWLRYHVDCRSRQGRGRLRTVREYLLTKGSIADENWQGSYRTLSDAKRAAQKEAILREDIPDGGSGWWRFHDHYDRDGYCDNPARGY